MTDALDKPRLVSWLINEGARHGLHTEAGYTNPEEGVSADAAWMLNTGQKPVFTFAVVEGSEELMASAMQWAGSSTEPKSWIHICIITNGCVKMPPSIPGCIKGYYAENPDHLSHALEDLTNRMIRLLQNFADDEPGGSRYERVKRLSGLFSDWTRGMRSSRLTLNAHTTFHNGLNLFAAEGLEDEETDLPALKPSRKIVPVDLVCGVTSFEGVLMRLVDANGCQLLLSSEHRNYPFIFRLTVAEGGESMIDLWFDSDKSNVPQALRFGELIEAVKAAGYVCLTGPSGVLAELTLKLGTS